MKTKQIIRDYAGRVLGSVETESNGNKIIRDFYGRILGRYDKRADVTRDLYGRVVAKGDQSSMLISNPRSR